MARRRKKKGGGGGGGHDAAGGLRWLLTYADMITLLLGVFIILAAAGSISKEKSEALAEAFSKIFGGGGKSLVTTGAGEEGMLKKSPGSKGGRGAGEGMHPKCTKKHVEEVFKKEVAEKGLKVEPIQQGLRLRFSDQVFFDTGSIEIKGEGKEVLDRAAGLFEGSSNRIIIEGHTDKAPIHTAEFRSNWDLSTGRATAVIHYLEEYAVQSGFSQDDLMRYMSRFSASGYGEYHPADPVNPYSQLNRRIDIIIVEEERKGSTPGKEEGLGPQG